MHIISILGTAGRNREGNLSTAEYKNTSVLSIENGKYLNSTDMLCHNFPTAKHTILSTKTAFEFQIKLFEEAQKPLHVQLLQHAISDDFLDASNDIDQIFDVILDIIKQEKNAEEELILDITHGLRHQPLMGAFATILGKISYSTNVKLLFAKEIEQHKKYEYVLLDSYANIGISSFVISSFLQTLTVPSIAYSDELIEALRHFASDLHTNALYSLFNISLPKVQTLLSVYKNNPSYKYMENLLDEVDKITSKFALAKQQQDYQQYYVLANIMSNKNYNLIAATYIYEAIPRYVFQALKKNNIMNDGMNDYHKISTAINQVIIADIKNPKIFDISRLVQYVDSYKEDFYLFKDLLEQIKHIRNNIVHINESYNTQALQETLKSTIDVFYELCIEKDVLGFCDFKMFVSDKNILEKLIQVYFISHFQLESFPKSFEKQCDFAKHLYVQDFNIPAIAKVHRERIIEQLAQNSKAQQIIELLVMSTKQNTINYDKFKTLLG